MRPATGVSSTCVSANSAQQDRHAVAVDGHPIAAVKGVGQPRQPFAQQPVDLLVVQPIADALQRLGVLARQHAVVQRLELDATLAQLALGVLVAVDAQLGVVGEVRALDIGRTVAPPSRYMRKNASSSTST